MIKMLISRTQITTLHKTIAHANINGNEHADTLAKLGVNNQRDVATPYKHTHPTPYYFQKD